MEGMCNRHLNVKTVQYGNIFECMDLDGNRDVFHSTVGIFP